MIKFYIVKPESELHQAYDRWLNDREKIKAVMSKFLHNNQLPSDTKYDVASAKLLIECTNEVKRRFGKSLCKELPCGGAYLRGNSKIAKEFTQMMRVANIKYYDKPSPALFARSLSGGRFRHKLFKHADVLYMSFDALSFDFDSNQFQELLGSEFYQILESVN